MAPRRLPGEEGGEGKGKEEKRREGKGRKGGGQGAPGGPVAAPLPPVPPVPLWRRRSVPRSASSTWTGPSRRRGRRVPGAGLGWRGRTRPGTGGGPLGQGGLRRAVPGCAGLPRLLAGRVQCQNQRQHPEGALASAESSARLCWGLAGAARGCAGAEALTDRTALFWHLENHG